MVTVRKIIGLWLPILAWSGLIFYLSSIPDLHITRQWWDIPLRKAAHMVEFGILALLWNRAFSGSTSWPRKRILLLSFLAAVLYACSDEYHQGFVPGRVPSWFDVLIDSVGAWIALRVRG